MYRNEVVEVTGVSGWVMEAALLFIDEWVILLG